MGASLVTPPASEPLKLDAVKMHCRVTGTDQDARLKSLITTAREYAEGFVGTKLITQTWDYSLPSFPACIELPFGPVQVVTSIKYIDAAGVEQTLASSEYQVDTRSTVPRIAPKYGKSWPSTFPEFNAVTVRFVAGYADAALVPERIKQAMQLLIGHWYENREAINVGNIVTEVPLTVRDLLFPLRVLSF